MIVATPYIPSHHYKKEVEDCLKGGWMKKQLYFTLLRMLQKGYCAAELADLDLLEEGEFAFYEGLGGCGLYRIENGQHHHLMTLELVGPINCEASIRTILDLLIEKGLWNWPEKKYGLL